MFGVLQEGTNSFAPVTRTKVQVNYFLCHHVEQFHDGHAQHMDLQKKIANIIAYDLQADKRNSKA